MRDKFCVAQSKAMREFGYPDVTEQMIDECLSAIHAGSPTPHGIIGMFTERAVEDLQDELEDAGRDRNEVFQKASP